MDNCDVPLHPWSKNLSFFSDMVGVAEVITFFSGMVGVAEVITFFSGMVGVAEVITFFSGMVGVVEVIKENIGACGTFRGEPDVTESGIFQLQRIDVEGVKLNLIFEDGCGDIVVNVKWPLYGKSNS